MSELLHSLPRNVVTIFTGRNLLWHVLAIVLTVAIVMSGLDWSYYQVTRVDVFPRLARPAIILGGLVPIFGTLLILIVGAVSRKPRLLMTGWALGQAALHGLVISSCYKAFTGRIPPPHHRGLSLPGTPLIDSSHGFQLGFLKGGMFWGWPSSHTTVAFAMAACLIALYPKNKTLRFFAACYAFYVGISISVTIHWFSEFVAGAIIGSVIGKVVGGSLR